MKLTAAQKLIAAIVAFVVVIALAVFLLIVPQFGRMARLDDDIAQAEQDVKDAQSLLAQRQSIKQRSSETEAKLLRLANELPENPELPGFIIDLQDTLNDSGLEFVSMEPSEPEDRDGGFRAISVDIAMKGRWQDIVDVLQRLRRLTRQVRIVSFEVIPVNESAEETQPAGTGPSLEAEMTIEVYSMIPPGSQTTTVPAAPTQ